MFYLNMFLLNNVKETVKRQDRLNKLVIITLALSIISLVFEQERYRNDYTSAFTNILDFSILIFIIFEVVIDFIKAGKKTSFLKSNLFNILFLLVFSLLFAYNKALFFTGRTAAYAHLPAKIIIIRNLFVLFKVFGRIRRLNAFLKNITAQPARTLMASFILAIITGTILLMLPFTTSEASGLSFIDSLFTATSAICVTGLIVVETATAFTFWGKLIILMLIQIGGLGIMILSFFVVFILRRSISVEDKFLISYMLSEKDMTGLSRNLKSIIYVTLSIEAAGALLLFLGFRGSLGSSFNTVFTSIFHAVSAFCNAGFSLFSDSLERFKSNLLINLVICLLIISGGMSFLVLVNIKDYLKGRVSKVFLKKRSFTKGLSLNTRVVLIGTAVLLFSGLLILYATEHRNSLLQYDLKTQYFAAFFQSVTLRTAGFNTIGIASLTTSTYLIMILFMFIGGASGSTAGGVKINSVVIIMAYIRSILKDQDEVTLFKRLVPKDLVLRALLILLFGIAAILAGTLLLTMTERAPFIHLVFETVSAFGTVGLSAGITSSLTIIGKCVIIILMFIGRVGPLTLLAAAAQRARKIHIEYPQGDITIG